ncbi:MAG TPA: ABC transporter ATP-binding protein [Hyphomonadaceae bacterium]|nr:ABC transporter ATP-binding protein [Hyphomonadaceae bacterium]HPN06637.1 ABC transporter ATP-binding protein [Hyphomonadaceae bacterium]
MSSPRRAVDLKVFSSEIQNRLKGAERRDGTGEDRRPCAIEIENVTLRYPIGPFVRGSLKSGLLRVFGHKEQGAAIQFVDGLKDLNLNIALGERVGIVGRNGSGKSTLLRMLAGIYPVKAGTVRVLGQIGTLLDIGLGFETESTGRENIYYRGIAMGHSPARLKEVEQEIIDFADIGQFIDLPMRTYSAGMQVRLGFAISTQLSPDILLIDEIFGAGDALFQKRALARIMDVVRHAGIMMLATHDLALVDELCTRVIWLDSGRVVRDGPTETVMPHFKAFMRGEQVL